MDVRPSVFRFGEFEVDLESGELRKRGVRVKLQEQPFQVLTALLQRPGEVITREALHRRLWPPDIAVDFERGLNKAVNRLREALEDDANSPRFIETLPQRGYRFLVAVESSPAASPEGLPVLENSPADVAQPFPRRTFLIAALGLVSAPVLYLGYRRFYPPHQPIKSLAVLPVENLSGDPSQEYFSDGMTDQLIGEIARIGSLRVISRTSIMQYKAARKSLPAIAHELNVEAILEGTVLQSGQRVRMTAKLIRADDDRPLWSETYERDLSDILTLQSELARVIAGRIRVQLTPAEKTSLAKTRPVKREAYEAYLRGNFFLQKGVPGIARSVEFFKEAIRQDPMQADAYAGLAEALCFAGIFGLRPSAETFPEARVAAIRALELDPSSAGAHNALASVKGGYDWDLAGAQEEYLISLQLNPSRLLTRLWCAENLARRGLFDQAISESDRAVALDPVSPVSLNNRSMIFFRARRFNDAIRTAQLALDLDPAFINALWWQGLSYAGNQDFSRSVACLQKGIAANDGPLFRALLSCVYGRSGDTAKALELIAELKLMAGRRFVSPMDFAVAYAGLGDTGSTFIWLEKAYRDRATRIHELPSMYFDSVRKDPRYPGLLRRVGLPVPA